MTLEEYDKEVRTLTEGMEEMNDFAFEVHREIVGEFQTKHMKEFLAEMQEKIELETAVCEILDYLIRESLSGSVIHYVDTEEKAEKLVEYMNQHEVVSDMLLDSPDIYKSRSGTWAVDCMFGGLYCPYWDGWRDE